VTVVPRELLESEAVEEPAIEGDAEEEAATRPLPEPVPARGEVSLWRAEMRTAAIAAGAGIVAGAATVAAVRATRPAVRRRSGRRSLLGRERPQRVVASRSFLVDVHMLGSK
jgi:hypothetical protein